MTPVNLLVCYPRSGSTWLRLMLLSLWQGGAAVRIEDAHLFAQSIAGRGRLDWWSDVETAHLSDAEVDTLRARYHRESVQPDPGNLYKVQEGWFDAPDGRPIFGPPDRFRIAYLVRDPRDVAISISRFFALPIDDAISLLNDPDAEVPRPATRHSAAAVRQRLGNWTTHAAGWLDASGFDAVVVRYEDLHADTEQALKRVADHYGWQTEADTRAAAAEHTQFAALAGQERERGFAAAPRKAERFFVEGRTGGWRDVLSREQASRIERAHEAAMARFGYLPRT